MLFDPRVRRGLAAALLCPFLLGGCFSFAPLRQPSPPRASVLQLQLSTPGDYRLGDITVNDVDLVEGELVSMDSSTVVVSATRVVARSGFEHLGESATLTIPRSSISGIRIKRLSPLRTALFSGALVALSVAIGAAAGGGIFSSSTDTGGPVSK